MDFSLQLYSARNFQPWEEVLKLVAEAGYAAVEGFGDAYADPPGLRAGMDRNRLAMPTAHFSLGMLENEFDAVRGIAEALGVELLVCPWLDADLRPADAAGWQAFGERLAAVGERAAKAGYGFAWHNHDFEFEPLGDGSIPQQIILEAAPAIGWEIDVAWVARSGADPLAWIDAYGARIVAAHIKDIAPPGQAEDEDGWADVGHGVMDWPGLLEALRENTPVKIIVMEHDNPRDFGRFARRSIEAVRRYQESR